MAIIKSSEWSEVSDEDLFKLPKGQKIDGLYDIIVNPNSWDWKGPDKGFVARLSTMPRGAQVYSSTTTRKPGALDERATSIRRLKKIFINTDDIPKEIRDIGISRYLYKVVKGEKFYHYSAPGEKYKISRGSTVAYKDEEAYYDFVKRLFEHFNINIQPSEAFIEAEISSREYLISGYEGRQRRGALASHFAVSSSAGSIAVVDRLKREVQEIKAWRDSTEQLQEQAEYSSPETNDEQAPSGVKKKIRK